MRDDFSLLRRIRTLYVVYVLSYTSRDNIALVFLSKNLILPSTTILFDKIQFSTTVKAVLVVLCLMPKQTALIDEEMHNSSSQFDITNFVVNILNFLSITKFNFYEKLNKKKKV